MLMKDAERIKSSLENALLSAGCDMLFFCADGEVQKQADQISQMISESCNAIVVWPVGDGVAQVLSQAKDNDIGVLLFLEKISDCSSADFFVGVDYRALGALQAEYIRDELDLDNAAGLNRKVAICGGILGNVKCLEALEGAMEVLQQYIDSCAIEQTEPAYVSQISRDAGRELAVARGWGQELSAVLGLTEGVPAGVVAALCEKGCDAGNIPIVTGAGDDMETLANVRYGLQSMTVPCGYELLAAEAASAVAMLLNGEAPEGNTVISDDGGYEIAGFVGCGEACDVNTDFALKPRKLLYISINSQSGNENRCCQRNGKTRRYLQIEGNVFRAFQNKGADYGVLPAEGLSEFLQGVRKLLSKRRANLQRFRVHTSRRKIGFRSRFDCYDLAFLCHACYGCDEDVVRPFRVSLDAASSARRNVRETRRSHNAMSGRRREVGGK